MNFFKSVLGPPAKIEIELEGHATRTTIELSLPDGKKENVPLFTENEQIKGSVAIKLDQGTKKIEHTGVKIAMIGVIKSTSGNVHEFLSVVKELEPMGILTESKNYQFEFENVERVHESYSGINISLNYYLKVTIFKSISNITKQLEFWVQNYSSPPETNSNIKMEVGIEDCLHIEFEYNRSKYHLKDVIIGKIYFLLVRLKIKNMNLSLIKRETTGTGLDMYNENRTLSKFEIMDGAPVKGEAIPVRLFLGGFELTPTYKDVCNKFSVSYILNLVLVDEDDRRYFKQREITLWRKSDKRIASDRKANETSAITAKMETRSTHSTSSTTKEAATPTDQEASN